MNECMNEGRLNYRLISMCVCIYVSLLHDSASGGARTALAPCLETWLAPWLAPRYGSRQPTLYLLGMILLLLLVGSLQCCCSCRHRHRQAVLYIMEQQPTKNRSDCRLACNVLCITRST